MSFVLGQDPKHIPIQIQKEAYPLLTRENKMPPAVLRFVGESQRIFQNICVPLLILILLNKMIILQPRSGSLDAVDTCALFFLLLLAFLSLHKTPIDFDYLLFYKGNRGGPRCARDQRVLLSSRLLPCLILQFKVWELIAFSSL